MKIVCQACEMRAAETVCCTCAGKERVCVCADCDFKLHATPHNLPLDPPHQRHLLSAPNLPNCDACKGMMGFFFCLEERKMLCRECDVSFHLTAPKSAHQRIFLPLVKVDSLDVANKDHHNNKPAIDVPESSHSQLMPSDEFFEFEGDANGLLQSLHHSQLPAIDVPESSHSQLMPSDEFFEFEGDANGLLQSLDHSQLMNEDFVEEAPEFLLPVHGFDHVISDNRNNHDHVIDPDNNSDVVPPQP